MSAAVESLLETLAQHGERVALVQAGQQLSYTQLLHEISARAHGLRQVGAKRLGLALDNGLEWVLWDLAALVAGIVCVPVPGFFSPAQQRHVLDSAGVDSLIAADASAFAALGFGAVAAIGNDSDGGEGDGGGVSTTAEVGAAAAEAGRLQPW